MTEEELEKKIALVYKRASDETTKKLENYTSQFEKKDREMLAKYRAGEITRKEYDDWRVGQVAIGKRWEAMRNQLAKDMLNADDIAKGMINNYLPEAYAEGFNFASYQVADAIGFDDPLNASLTLYDRDAVENLIKNEPDLLPQLKPESQTAKDIRAGRILRWDNQKINAEVTQGLLQGESMDKVAKRMKNVVGMSERSAIRNARTAVNGASNAGKERGFERAEELGIEVEQVWLASLDDRTRIEHRKLDGQVRKLGEKFKVDGYEIGYPCDPTAEPEMVYNCRCTVVPYLPKYDNKIDLEDRNTDKMTDESYEKWKEGQKLESEARETNPTDAEPTKEATVSEKPVSESRAVEEETFKPATNREEANELLRELGFDFDEYHTDRVSETLLVSNANQLAKLDARFNAIGDRELRIGHFTGEIEGAYAGHDPKTGDLLINTDYFRNTKIMRNAIEKAIEYDEDGRFDTMPVAKEYYDSAVLTHEYGHILQQVIWEEDMGNSKFTEDGESYNPDYQQWTIDVCNEIYETAKHKTSYFDPTEQLSLYAEVDSQEFFAECFMNAFCGKPNALGKAMLEWLEKEGY